MSGLLSQPNGPISRYRQNELSALASDAPPASSSAEGRVEPTEAFGLDHEGGDYVLGAALDEMDQCTMHLSASESTSNSAARSDA